MIEVAGRIGRLPRRPLMRWALTNALALVAVAVISILASHGASAQAQSVLGSCPQVAAGPNLNLNVLPNIYCTATMGWLGNALTAAQRFFFILVGIELAWSAMLWTLQKENLGELVTAFILKLMGIFFFYALLMFGSSWLPAVMQSFIGLAAQVTTPGQQPLSLDPMTVFNLGTNVCRMLFQNLPTPHFDTNIVAILIPFIGIINDLLTWYFFEMVVVFAALISFVVFASFLIAAGQLIMTLVEAYIMIGAGAVMLGFTGSRWTMSFGEKWIGYAFAIGVKLFVIYIVVALGVTVFPSSCPGSNDYSGICAQLNAISGASVSVDITNFSGTANNIATIFVSYLEIAATAIIFMMLCQRLPGLAASMMNGSPSLTAGAAIATAMQVAGVVTGVVKAGAGAAMAAAGAGGAGMGGGGGAGLEAAASLGGGVDAGGPGGSMSPLLGASGDLGGGSTTSSASASSAVPGTLVAATSSASASLSGGSIGVPARASAAPANGATAPEPSGRNAQAAVHVASAIANGFGDAVTAAAAPFTNFDEGAAGGGGSVHIGLRMPE